MSIDWGSVAATLDAWGDECGLEVLIPNATGPGGGTGSRGIQAGGVDRGGGTLPARVVVVRPLIVASGDLHGTSEPAQLRELVRAVQDCAHLVEGHPRRWAWGVLGAHSRWAA